MQLWRPTSLACSQARSSLTSQSVAKKSAPQRYPWPGAKTRSLPGDTTPRRRATKAAAAALFAMHSRPIFVSFDVDRLDVGREDRSRSTALIRDEGPEVAIRSEPERSGLLSQKRRAGPWPTFDLGSAARSPAGCEPTRDAKVEQWTLNLIYALRAKAMPMP